MNATRLGASMTKTREMRIIATTMREQHLNRNPRVISFRTLILYNKTADDEVLVVEYDPHIAVPAFLAHEARALGLDEISAFPHC